jgi:anti-anti-sigma regulatory factor
VARDEVTIVELCGRITAADVPGLAERLRILIREEGADEVVCDATGVRDPDAATIDALARLQLEARRLGGQVRVRNASHELRELLTLAGLCAAVPASAGSGVEAVRQPEQREQRRGVEERVHRDDLAP